jgi:hypothetical protein
VLDAQPFQLHQIPHYPRTLDKFADEVVQAVDHSYRVGRRVSLGIVLVTSFALPLKHARRSAARGGVR